MKKLLLGTIVTICCLNAVAKNNEVIKLKSPSRQVVADKIDENLEKTLDFSQSNIIGSEALKELKKSSTNEDNETSENILVPFYYTYFIYIFYIIPFRYSQTAMNKGTEGIKKQLFGRIKTTFWEFKNDFSGK